MGTTMHEDDFCKRLIQLRLEKGVSARDMSLSIGQSEAYINRIENRKMLPSPSKEIIDAIKKLQSLNPKKQKHILAVIHDL